MKDFRVLVGTSEDSLTEVLQSALRNDSAPETFSLRYVNQAGISFPTRYVQIVPLSAHGQSFHISIWHVALNGIADEEYVEQVRIHYEEHQEDITMKRILKHLRQRRLLTPLKFIQDRCKVQLEHPLVSQLFETLVLRGQFAESEQCLRACSDSGLFDSFVTSSQSRAHWKRINAVDADGDYPMKRGGHAMCIDSEKGLIYLHGGWDGTKNLDDYWVYEIPSNRWKLLSQHTSQDKNGPGPRACHKMVFDQKTGCIYLLGKLGDEEGSRLLSENATEPKPPAAGEQQFCSEFYRYRTRGIDHGNWELLNFDTAASGGPPLLFDHQLVIDSESQIIYVFGGRVVDGEKSPIKYSGFYSYNIPTSKWKNLQPDPAASQTIPLRFGHSMVFEPLRKSIFIFAGQREEKYLADLWIYDTQSGMASEACSDFTSSGGPDACFTQRSVINVDAKEIYMICGLTRGRAGSSAKTELRLDFPKWVYRYEPYPGKWMRILPGRSALKGGRVEEPQARYAHQFVYDPRTGQAFMHGGNGGFNSEISQNQDKQEGEVGGDGGTRLDDFWSMRLERISPEEIIRRTSFKIRTQQFREMCEEQPAVRALNFLQTEVCSVVDHSSTEEAALFRSLLTYLLNPAARCRPITPGRGRGHGHGQSQQHQEGSRKRSRSEEDWTNRLSGEWDEDVDMTNGASEASSGITTLTIGEDPLEQSLRNSLASTSNPPDTSPSPDDRHSASGLVAASTATPDELPPPSPPRFKQRVEVFETLLEFINDNAKEPSGDLLDCVNVMGGI